MTGREEGEMTGGRRSRGALIRRSPKTASPMLSSPRWGEGWMRGSNTEGIFLAILRAIPWNLSCLTHTGVPAYKFRYRVRR